MSGLRVEMPIAKPPVKPPTTLEQWRTLALSTSERLSYAETQLTDLRSAADEARERLTKAKGRLDSANARINTLTTELVAMTAERDNAVAKLKTQAELKRALWELWAEL